MWVPAGVPEHKSACVWADRSQACPSFPPSALNKEQNEGTKPGWGGLVDIVEVGRLAVEGGPC